MEGSKILVIIKDFDLRTKISEMLRIGKYNVKSTDSGKLAIDMIRNNPFDVVICGINLLDIDGFGVLGLVNKFIETASVSFIMLLADQNYDLARRAMEMGVDGYLTTPFDDGELLNQVEVRLRKKKFQRERFLKQHIHLGSLQHRSYEMAWLKLRFEERLSTHLKKSQVLYARGERRSLGLHYVISGKIKTYVTDSLGNSLITNVYGAGEYFGLQGTFMEVESIESAEAIDSAEVSSISLSDVHHLLSDHPQLLTIFVKDLVKSLNDREDRLLEMAYYSVRKRIAKALVRLTERSYNLGENGRFLLPRNDLARITGVASETLSRVLTDFAKEKLIEKDGHDIIVLDTQTLKTIKN